MSLESNSIPAEAAKRAAESVSPTEQSAIDAAVAGASGNKVNELLDASVVVGNDTYVYLGKALVSNRASGSAQSNVKILNASTANLLIEDQSTQNSILIDVGEIVDFDIVPQGGNVYDLNINSRVKLGGPVALDLGVIAAPVDLDQANIYRVVIGGASAEMTLPAHTYGKEVIVDVYGDTTQTGGFVFAPEFEGPLGGETVIWEGGVEPTAPGNNDHKRYIFFSNGSRWLGRATGEFLLP